MLAELSIRGLSVLEHVNASFSDGFSVITGESGAGKSVFVYALSLLAGERAKKEVIRKDSKSAFVRATFINIDRHPLIEILEPYGIELDDDVVTVSREINKDRSIARINGCIVPLEALKVLANELLMIYAQHDQIELLDKDTALHYVDRTVSKELLDAVRNDVMCLRALEREEKTLLTFQERAREIELLGYQINEIERAALFDIDEDALFAEYKELSHIESILESLAKIDTFIEDDEGFGVEEGILEILKTARSLSQYGYEDLILSAESLDAVLGEVRYANRLAMDRLTPDPTRKDALYQQISEIDAIKRKYGPEKTDVQAFYENAIKRKAKLENADKRAEEITKQRKQIETRLNQNTNELTFIRRREAQLLSDRVTTVLKELSIPYASFSVHVDAKSLDADGKDLVDFYFSANEGEDEKLLREVASGGETSRIMLALLISGECIRKKTLVFDEIDTGLSGRTAQRIAEKLFDLSLDSQVLAISHLPQIASMADTHFLIEKKTEGERTCSILKRLDLEDREREMMRLVGGVDLTATTREHAQEMLSQSMIYRERNDQRVQPKDDEIGNHLRR